jgi:serine/threonine-protein phosphatase 6 regulatory ankyrin repeat subunit B
MSKQKEEQKERKKGYTSVLMIAIKNDDVAQLKWILKEKTPFLDEIRDGYTPLLWATAHKANYEIIKLLVDDGANVEVRNNAGVTPLMFASDYGQLEVVNLFLNAIPDPEKRIRYINMFNSGGNTALIIASDNGHTDVASRLVDEGANIHAQNGDGNDALMISLREKRFNTVNMLIDRGANVRSQNSVGDTPLMVAELYGYDLLIEALLNNILDQEEKMQYINVVGPWGYTALMVAVASGDTPIEGMNARASHEMRIQNVELLLNNGANVDVTNGNGESIMDIAANKPDILRLLHWKRRQSLVELHENSATDPSHHAPTTTAQKLFSDPNFVRGVAEFMGGRKRKHSIKRVKRRRIKNRNMRTLRKK